MRINKAMADRGLASRREADRLIATGGVTVNGEVAHIGQQVREEDVIAITGTKPQYRYIAYYKPRGIITHSPAPNEVDIEMVLRSDHRITGLAPIGRLDKDSEGLIICSDDGRLTAPLLNPESSIEKEYEVTVDKDVSPRVLRRLANGVDIEGYVTKPAKATPKNNRTFFLTLIEGKKHQIRRMCAALGYQVTSLKRVRVATITIDGLAPNTYRDIRDTELTTLAEHLGLTL